MRRIAEDPGFKKVGGRAALGLGSRSKWIISLGTVARVS